MSKKLKKSDKLTKFLTVTDRDFVLIFIGFMERVFNSTIPSGISHLVSLYADAQDRIIWINNPTYKWKDVYIEDGATIRLKGVLFLADPAALNTSQVSKYEVVLRMNEMAYYSGFCVGYVFGCIADVEFDWCLGRMNNKKNSVGIMIWRNKFYLFDEDHLQKQLQCEAEDGPSTFPLQGQFWRVTWDLIDNEMKISVLNEQETDWIPMIHYVMKEEHRDTYIIPAISMRDMVYFPSPVPTVDLQWKSVGMLE